MRDTLEKQILADAYFGDTTVFAELLGLLTDTQVYNALSDSNQQQFKTPEESVTVSMTIAELRNLFIAGSTLQEDYTECNGDEEEMVAPDFGEYMMLTKEIDVDNLK